MKIWTLLAFLLYYNLQLFAQTTDRIECDLKTLEKAPHFATDDISQLNDLIWQKDINMLKRCGELDLIDSITFLSKAALGSIMIQSANQESISYQTILNAISELKQTEIYQEARKQIIAYQQLTMQAISLNSLEANRELLLNTRMSEDEFNDFKRFVQDQYISGMTYEQAFDQYETSKKGTSEEIEEATNNLEFSELSDLKAALQAGRKSNKNILIFFSCHYCVNATRMEEKILSQVQIASFIQEHYVSFMAYVDNIETNNTASAALSKKRAQLQTKHFKSDSQPYFYIINPDGKVLSEIAYTNSPEAFMKFLQMGLTQ